MIAVIEASRPCKVICGGVNSKSYILETVGCGAAFLDYDNDGWLDIFLLSGTTIEGLHELEKGKLRGTVISAVRVATDKSKKLGQG